MTDAEACPGSAALRILLVEDNDLNRELLGDYLRHCGYEVFTLAQGSGFFLTIEQFQPHLVLLDLRLPDVDGYQLLEELQQKPHLPQLPIIVISGFAFQEEQQRALKLGARRYLVKPVSLTKLIEAIEVETYTLSS
ncbi:response regulator [Trichocoleus sp. FACHB-591]|uniref:response regulator n=1 Tax=Trichocoleus sp. FACHB-591 TaxID=2692872 RepID=UPI0016854CE4|nr:response regulator [Trichocoleus sp. FACHB-591]MBD2096348.1 response regulator [Trichocoleus sp. FACHB-591]